MFNLNLILSSAVIICYVVYLIALVLFIKAKDPEDL